MLTIKYHKKFKRDYKRIQKRGRNVNLLDKVIQLLAECKPLPARMRDHPLVGDYAGYRECHIESDWLLIYKIEKACSSFSLFRALELMQIFLENKRKAFCKRILIRHKRPGG